MIIDFVHYTRILKNIFYFVLLIICVYIILKTFVFFSPFFIGFIIANFLEPFIRFLMIKMNFTRKQSVIICMTLLIFAIIFITGFIINSIFKEIYNMSQNANIYTTKINEVLNYMLNKVNLENFDLSSQIKDIIMMSTNNLIEKITIFISSIINNMLNIISKIPEIAIYSIITILATYFIAADKYYIKDQFEHHVPRAWVKKFNFHFKEIFEKLINYIKAELILVFISFIIVLLGLYIIKFIGFNIGYPFLVAIFIGIVDALPILRFWNCSCPMGYFESTNGGYKICFCIIYFIYNSSTCKRITRA